MITKTKILAVSAVLSLGACGGEDSKPFEFKGTIYAKGFSDITGGNGAVGTPWLYGMHDLARELNERQGIAGYKVDFEWIDYAYDIKNAVDAYYGWRMKPEWSQVAGIMGYGTADTRELRDEATEDQKPFFSASFSAMFTVPQGKKSTIQMPDGTQHTFDYPPAPYNYFVSADYSTMIRASLNFMKKQGGKKVAFAACTNTPFCTDQGIVLKSYAGSVGLQLGGDLVVQQSLTDNSAAVIEERVQAFVADPNNAGVDWVWVGNSRASSNEIVKSFAKHAPNVKLIVITWGFDENVYPECGQPCVGREFGVTSFAPFGDTRYAGMEDVVRIHTKWRQRDGHEASKYADMKYVMGHATFLTWTKGVEKVLQEGKAVTGPNIKAALESFRRYEIGGLTPPVTYTADDHRPMNSVRIYSINTDGKLKYEEDASVDLTPDSLGW
jgi:branched-chain amino acid transport system substrate-binding protein